MESFLTETGQHRLLQCELDEVKLLVQARARGVWVCFGAAAVNRNRHNHGAAGTALDWHVG